MEFLHAVALSNAVERNQVILAYAPDREVALWRNSAGVLQANQNRCPHRGMRLHFGFVRDDRLNCLYHGWSYDDQGQCKYIPAHPAHTPSNVICLQTYAVQETQGLIWIGRAPVLPPHLAALQATPVRSLYLAAGMAEVLAALQMPPRFFAPVTPFCADEPVRHERIEDRVGYWLAADGKQSFGCLYAVQDAGDGRVGIHVVALSPAAKAAPVEFLLSLSADLQVLEQDLCKGVKAA